MKLLAGFVGGMILFAFCIVPYVDGNVIERMKNVPKDMPEGIISMNYAIALAFLLYALGYIPFPPFYNIGGMASGFLHAVMAYRAISVNAWGMATLLFALTGLPILLLGMAEINIGLITKGMFYMILGTLVSGACFSVGIPLSIVCIYSSLAHAILHPLTFPVSFILSLPLVVLLKGMPI